MTTQPERCPTCDRPDCKTMNRGAQDFWAWKWATDECRSKSVDWRARALAAEAAHHAAPAAIGDHVLRFAPPGAVMLTASQRDDILRMLDAAPSAPPEVEPTPTPEEVEELAEHLYHVSYPPNAWGRDAHAPQRAVFRTIAREAWRLGARTRSDT